LSISRFETTTNLYYTAEIVAGPGSIWIDNFNLMLFASKPTMQTGALRDANWTGVAVHQYHGPPVSMKCVRGPNGHIVSAMPETIDKLLEYVPLVLSKIKADVVEHGRKLRQKSLMKKFKVHTIPVRPEVNSTKYPGLKIDVAQASVSLSSLYPLNIIPINVGSKRGFMNIFKQFYDEYIRPPVNKDRYYMLMLDAALYYSLIKVSVYDCDRVCIHQVYCE